MNHSNIKIKKSHIIMFLSFLIVLAWSASKPLSYINWVLEVSPVLILVLILVLTYRSFKFTTFAYATVLIHSIILFIGGEFTYGPSPSFYYYSYLSYFTSGFALVVIIKEFLLKKHYFKKSDMHYYMMISIAVALIQSYKTISFFIALIINAPGYTGLSYNQFLSSFKWSMFMSLVGAIVAITVFGKIHNQEIK